MLNVSGYEVSGPIHQGARTVVYRAQQRDATSVVIKAPRNPHPSPAELAAIRAEFEIGRGIEHPGVVRTLALEQDGHRPVLVLEDFGGRSLALQLDGSPLELERFFELALSLAEALGELHRRGITHKDINPANIILNPQTGQIKLSDLSIASVLRREGLRLASPNVMEGTLRYMAPEQTGRLNRTIDYRADFYSLGATLFEMLTGRVPFDSDDLVELLHSHIARTPQSPSALRAEVPPALSAVVLKLLAKNAEDRYQSASGLAKDLFRCRELVRGGHSGHDFVPGQHDVTSRFQIPEKLYGRQRQQDLLKSALERAADGSRQLVVVAGESGIGKSSLAHELHWPVVQRGGWFVSGRFDHNQRDVPHSALIQAVQALVQRLLTESEQRLAGWQERLQLALGDEGHVLVRVIPELALVIGEQPPVAELAGDEAEHRFDRLFRDLLRAFTSRQRPLAVFLDDLQWADHASLRLLEALLADAQVHHLLLIMAYRPDEVDAVHPLSLSLRAMEDGPAEVHTLLLKPLGEGPIAQLIADTVHRGTAETQPLAEMVRHKTLGNPFFVNGLLRSLYDQGLVRFDQQVGAWDWDLPAIKSLEAADDVVDLLLQKMAALSGPTLRTLELASCIGSRFDVGTLMIIADQPMQQVAAALRPAVEDGLITTVCGGFNRLVRWDQKDLEANAEMLQHVRCDFQHDRIQQALHDRISVEEHHEIHMRLGRLLLSRLDQDALEQRLFEVVHHLNHSGQQLNDDAERLRVAMLNLRAGQKAWNTAASETAQHYFKAGIQLLPGDRWERCHELTFELYHGLYGSRLLKIEGAAEVLALGEEMLAQARGTTEQLRALTLHVMQLSTRGRDPERALTLGTAALREMGIDIDPPDAELVIQQGYAELKDRLSGDGLEALVNLPVMADQQKIEAMNLLEHLFFFPVFMRRRELGPLVALAAVRLSLEHGNGPGSGMAYSTWGLVVAFDRGDFRTGYRLGRTAVAVADKLGSQRAMTRALVITTDWPCEPAKRLLERIRGSHRLAQQTGETFAAAMLAGNTTMAAVMAGEPLQQVLEEGRPLIPHITGAIGDIGPREVHLNLRFAEALLGLREPTSLYSDPAGAERAVAAMEQRNPEGVHAYYMLEARLHYLLGQPARAVEMIDLARQWADARIGHPASYEMFFHQALALAAVCDQQQGQPRATTVERLRRAVDKLAAWVEAGAGEFFGPMQLLATGEAARVAGDWQCAAQAYERGIARCAELGLVQYQALANELAAHSYLQQGLDKVARVYLHDAVYGYEKWGAKAKVEQLLERHPELRAPEVAAKPGTASSRAGSSTSTGGSESFDFASVIKATLAISSEMMLSALLDRMLGILVENAGAERGFLLLAHDESLRVEAASGAETSLAGRAEPTPLAQCDELPVGVVQYVARTGSEVVLTDAAAEGMFQTDPYVCQQQVRAVLCVPLVSQGKQLGVVYLDNNLTSGAFTAERLEVVRLLCAQAAISIENARLYGELEHSNLQLADYSRTLEQKVEERTHDLADKNEQLNTSLRKQQQMQQQLVISEKMASLGNLVAGVAHEINTPIGAMASSTDTSRRAVDKLEIALGKTDGPPLDDRRVKRLLEMLRSNLEVMDTGSGRVTRIVHTLRNFARLDEAERKRADLHEGIDSTLTLVGHRLKDGITVVKEYGDVEPIYCYPNQLNQVFMNLLVNAVDAIEGLPAGPAETTNRRITITTWARDEMAHVRIADTGPGIPDHLVAHIFDPGFTTKGVGVGTGLGLSICFNIVQKHQGTLNVDSQEGEGTAFTLTLPEGSAQG